MGNCTSKHTGNEETTVLSVNNFQFHFVIGKGGFGKVWKVESKKNKEVYALKEMSKAKIISKKSVNSVLNERQLLSQLNHNFIINMLYAFQDRENLYLIMDLMTGGDLRYHITRRKRFTEQETQFFAACIIAGLEFLHSNTIIHRDIKPENLVFDSQGYLRITDLGIARIWKPENKNDTSGTPGYMAPEVMCRQNHGIGVDYYALGVIIFECMIGRRPYIGKTRQEIRDQIIAKQVQIKKQDIPQNWSLEAADLVNRLIQRKPINRIGLNGPEEVKNHPWFKNFPWNKLYRKELQAPFVPAGEENFHSGSIRKDSENSPEKERENAIMLRRNSIQGLFEGYHYDKVQVHLNQQHNLANSNVSTRFNSIISNSNKNSQTLKSKASQ